MCLGELGRVVERHDDVALVRTNRGTFATAVLLAPHAAVGDHVVVHSGQVLSVIGAEEAAAAATLRARPDAMSTTVTTTTGG